MRVQGPLPDDSGLSSTAKAAAALARAEEAKAFAQEAAATLVAPAAAPQPVAADGNAVFAQVASFLTNTRQPSPTAARQRAGGASPSVSPQRVPPAALPAAAPAAAAAAEVPSESKTNVAEVDAVRLRSESAAEFSSLLRHFWLLPCASAEIACNTKPDAPRPKRNIRRRSPPSSPQ